MAELVEQRNMASRESPDVHHQVDQQRQQYYTPFTTRWPFLTGILILTMVVVIALEIGIRSGLSLDEKVELADHIEQKRWINARQPQDFPVASTQNMAPSAFTAPNATTGMEIAASSSANTYTQQIITATPFLPWSYPSQIATPSENLDNYRLEMGSPTNLTSGPNSSRSWADWMPSNWVHQGTNYVPLSTAASRSYVHPGTNYVPPKPTESNIPKDREAISSQDPPESDASGNDDVDSDSGGPSDDTTILSAAKKYSSGETHQSPSPSAYEDGHFGPSLVVSGSLTASEAQVSGSPVKYPDGVTVSALATTNSDGDSVTRVVTLTSPTPVLYSIVVGVVTIRDSTGGLSTLLTSSTSFYPLLVRTQLTTDGDGEVFHSHFFTEPVLATIAPTDATLPIPTRPPDQQRSDEVELGLALSNAQYFKAMYLPVLVAILLKLLWSTVFASTKMTEPFYLLFRDTGMSARELASSEYLSSSLSINGLLRIFSVDVVTGVCTTICLLINLLPALATQSTTVRTTQWCPVDGMWLRCNPMWYLDVKFSRAIQALLSVVAILIVTMMVLTTRQRTGVFSNPSSIATIASLLNHEPFRATLRKIPQTASESEIQELLAPSRYKLTRHPDTTSERYSSYGVVKVGGTTSPTSSCGGDGGGGGGGGVGGDMGPPLSEHRRNSSLSATDVSREALSSKRSRFSLPAGTRNLLQDIIFLLAILTTVSILVTYALTGGDTPINNFFNQHYESRLVLALAASLFDGRWKDLEREVRIMTPYRHLHKGGATFEATLLVTQNGTPMSSFIPAVWRGNWFHVVISFVAILSDMLIVTISGVPYSSAQIMMDSILCCYISIAILAVMALALLAMFRWRAINDKMSMPREPTTLVSVWMMLCNRDNGLCWDVRGSECMRASERYEQVSSRLRDEKYWAGWITQPGGIKRWCIEKESGKRQGKMEETSIRAIWTRLDSLER